MTYFLKPNQRSVVQEELLKIKNLEVYSKHLQRQLDIQQQTEQTYIKKIEQLQNRKKSLLSLIEQSIQFNAKSNHQPMSQQKKQMSPKKQLNLSNSKIPTNFPSMMENKSTLMNRSRIFSKPQKNINYLANINQFKFKDLTQEISSLVKQLNQLANKTSSKEMNKSLLIQSRFNTKNHLSSAITTQNDQSAFVSNYKNLFGQITQLPSSNETQVQDQVLTSLMGNLTKQEQKLLFLLEKQKQLQIQKLIKEHIHTRSIENMRIINNMKKRQQKTQNNKNIKSTKDIIKFGYTQKMLQRIKNHSIGSKN